MATLYTHSDSNKRKTWGLMSLVFIVLILFGWAFASYFDSPVILYAAVILSVLFSFGSYWWSDKLVLSISKAKPISRDSHRELYNVVENLCITAGLPLPRIYIIDDPSPNAFATGRDPEHAVIAFTTGLLNKLNRSEVEGVAAHELSHIGNRDMLVQTVVTVLVGAVVIMADIFMRSIIFGRIGGSDSEKGGQARVVMFIVALVLAILAPIFVKLLQLAISRKREFAADADGALLTRYPEGLASALQKISADPHELKSANRATAHMYIASPLRGKKSFFRKAFMTHPPVEERVAALRGMEVND